MVIVSRSRRRVGARSSNGVAIVLACCSIAAPRAQDADATSIRWRIGERGDVQISPDPVIGDGTGWATACDPANETLGVWSNLGVIGFTACLLTGDGDLLETTDARALFADLQVGDADLVRLLGTPPATDAPRHERLRFRLAMLAAGDRGAKPALGPLTQLAEDDAIGSDLRTTAVRAIGLLRGTHYPLPPVDIPALADALATLPRDLDGLLVVDQTRLAPARALLALSGSVGIAVGTESIRAAGESVGVAAIAGLHAQSRAPGLLGYELTRRYGDHRIVRTLVSFRVPPGFPFPEDGATGWLHARFDGVFDVPGLTAGLRADQVPHRAADGVVQFTVGMLALRVAADHATLRIGPVPQERIEEPRRDALLGALATDDSPIRAQFFKLPELPGLPTASPRSLGLTLPRQVGDRATLRLGLASAEAATDWAVQAQSAHEWCRRLADDETLDAGLRAAARTVAENARIAIDATTPSVVTIEAPLPEIDPETFAAWLAKLLQ